ncbi:MAG: ABC transporter substrate-binding protein [Betaproteobacteria bacterium]|jgi:ABC-type nitrate/sulfonate/bicarbonate transport system substrate-binding protein
MRFNLSRLSLFTIFLSFFFFESLQVNAQNLIPIRVAYVPVATWLPSWVAKEKGFFEKNGLNATLTPIQNLSLLPPTMGKQFDFAASTAPDLIKAAANGIDVVAVTGGVVESSSKQSMQVIVRKNSGINSPKDLKGKIIATPSTGAIMHVATLSWLKKNGVDPNSIRAVEVPFPNMVDQLKASRVDALELLQPFVGQILSQPDYMSIGNSMLSVSDPVLFVFWIANGGWAKSNMDTVKKWSQSIADANDFIDKNPIEARQILGKYTNLPQQVTEKIPLPAYEASLKPNQIDIWINVLKDLNLLPLPIEASKIVLSN